MGGGEYVAPRRVVSPREEARHRICGLSIWPNGGNIPFTDSGTRFVVQTSMDLRTWPDVLVGDTDLNNASGAVTYTLPTGAGEIFVRLTATQN